MAHVPRDEQTAVGLAIARCALPLIGIRAAGTEAAALVVNRKYEDLEHATFMARELTPEASRFEVIASRDEAPGERPPGGMLFLDPVVIAEFSVIAD